MAAVFGAPTAHGPGERLRANAISFTAAMTKCDAWRVAVELYAHAIRAGVRLDAGLRNAVQTFGYAKGQQWQAACRVRAAHAAEQPEESGAEASLVSCLKDSNQWRQVLSTMRSMPGSASAASAALSALGGEDFWRRAVALWSACPSMDGQALGSAIFGCQASWRRSLQLLHTGGWCRLAVTAVGLNAAIEACGVGSWRHALKLGEGGGNDFTLQAVIEACGRNEQVQVAVDLLQGMEGQLSEGAFNAALDLLLNIAQWWPARVSAFPGALVQTPAQAMVSDTSHVMSDPVETLEVECASCAEWLLLDNSDCFSASQRRKTSGTARCKSCVRAAKDPPQITDPRLQAFVDECRAAKEEYKSSQTEVVSHVNSWLRLGGALREPLPALGDAQHVICAALPRNVTPKLRDLFPEERRLELNLEDKGSEKDWPAALDLAHSFASARVKEGPIYVFCALGCNRSAVVAIALLMAIEDMSLDSALRLRDAEGTCRITGCWFPQRTDGTDSGRAGCSVRLGNYGWSSVWMALRCCVIPLQCSGLILLLGRRILRLDLVDALMPKMRATRQADSRAPSKATQEMYIQFRPQRMWLEAAWSEMQARNEPFCWRLDLFWRPQQLLLSSLRSFCSQKLLPLAQCSFRHKVLAHLTEEEDVQDRPSSGLYICGPFLRGASWDRRRGALVDGKMDEFFYRMPVMHFIPTKDQRQLRNRCPVPFFQADRGPWKSNGRDANFIAQVFLHAADPNDWLLKGVALFCEAASDVRQLSRASADSSELGIPTAPKQSGALKDSERVILDVGVVCLAPYGRRADPLSFDSPNKNTGSAMDDLEELYEHDVAYVNRVCIDNKLNVGKWYDVTRNQMATSVEHLYDTQCKVLELDMQKKPGLRIFAWDIETTKEPLKFPDSAHDRITMISIMVDREGSREVPALLRNLYEQRDAGEVCFVRGAKDLEMSQLADVEAVVIHRRIYPDALRLSVVVSDESCFEVCCQASSRRLWREIKLGDLISALGKWRHANTDSAARCGDVFAAVAVEVREMRHWGVQRCIAAQKRLFTRGERAPPAAPVQAPKAALCSAYGAHEAHGGGDLAALSKRCEAVADLVLEVAGGKDVLNRGSGVVDVAGGTGLLSLALAMRGVRCTVVDPRSSCGCLPSRARKLARKTGAKELVSARRAWFGGKLVGADDAFKGAQDEVPSVTEDCELVRESSALCALHPDEATELVVDTALRLRKPFVVVPCCVFARLFPHRRLDGGQVSSVPDFLSFLQAKHPCIRKVQLPFDGANWALFSASAAECGERIGSVERIGGECTGWAKARRWGRGERGEGVWQRLKRPLPCWLASLANARHRSLRWVRSSDFVGG
ncbi:unnamed protein product [Effrenium voratum]|nr:unnamed protein product [Effrenium voratum]